MYGLQPLWADPADAHQTHQFNHCRHRERCFFRVLSFCPKTLLIFSIAGYYLHLNFLLDILGLLSLWIPNLLWPLPRRLHRLQLWMSLLIAPAGVAAEGWVVLNMTKHTLCLSCRDVTCSVDVRCSECSSWSTESMAEYLRHRRSLVLEGKKKSSVTTPSSSSPSVLPSATLIVVSQSPSPSLTSIADDDKIKQYCMCILFWLQCWANLAVRLV